ncbi:universal stress protein family [Dissulfuribacter thermophilus]|uniref:Universal stress protein n=1 Tax=Dissulfuribacter thermophilus TaxID=1156395 RepID=A0A1B9F894_9BACT|nr:universal stress protein [Dissulfuribacter thermophilus]OCC16136.1 universal stress protein family [Dissulfuribacter thermophilus]
MVEIKKILFPTDLATSSEKVVPYVKLMADKLGAEIHIIHVMRSLEDFGFLDVVSEDYSETLSSYEKELRVGTEKALDKFIADNFSDQSNVQKFITIGDIINEIIDYADKNQIDMIIMGTHSKKGLEKIMFGSVANGVVKRADCPVLTVNPYKMD